MRKLTPLKAIRKYCLWCVLKNSLEVRLCQDNTCPLYPLRFGKRKQSYSVLKAIRQRCKDCSEGTLPAIKNCEFPDCSLFIYRSGHNPSRRGIGRKGGNPLLKGGLS